MKEKGSTEKNANQIMMKVCGFIVDKRNLFFLIFGILIVFSAISRKWVGVENSMSYYLPGTTETRQGLDLMEEEFITYGTCNVMIANVSYEQAEDICERLESIGGIFSVDFDDSGEHYTNGSAYYNITFDYVSWGSYSVFAKGMDTSIAVANVLSWVIAVLFAYVTNKLFVFHSYSWKPKHLFREFSLFLSARLGTGVLEIVLVPLLVHWGINQSIFGVKGAVSKVLVSFLVVILNYVFSKLFIFKSQTKEEV